VSAVTSQQVPATVTGMLPGRGPAIHRVPVCVDLSQLAVHPLSVLEHSLPAALVSEAGTLSVAAMSVGRKARRQPGRPAGRQAGRPRTARPGERASMTAGSLPAGRGGRSARQGAAGGADGHVQGQGAYGRRAAGRRAAAAGRAREQRGAGVRPAAASALPAARRAPRAGRPPWRKRLETRQAACARGSQRPSGKEARLSADPGLPSRATSVQMRHIIPAHHPSRAI
jgi:hypothetical protein